MSSSGGKNGKLFGAAEEKNATICSQCHRTFSETSKDRGSKGYGRQLLKSATSVAANYRSARRSRSRAEFISKIGIVVEEADETVFWIELLGDANILGKEQLKEHDRESNELLSIFAATYHTAKGRNR